MNQTIDEQVRALARPLWESAARPFGMAMDFWLMAEQMVLELMAATTRIQTALLTEPDQPPAEDLPAAAPVGQIRALAECMWEAAGRQYELSQDFWLAAEEHVLAMIRAAHSPRNAAVQDLCHLTPAAYLERIRAVAYYMWESTGRQYGKTLDFWLAAEHQVLAALRASYVPERATPRAAAAGFRPADDAVADDAITASAEPAAEDIAAAAAGDDAVAAPEAGDLESPAMAATPVSDAPAPEVAMAEAAPMPTAAPLPAEAAAAEPTPVTAVSDMGKPERTASAKAKKAKKKPK